MSEKPPESSVMGISSNGGVSMDIPLKYKRRKVSAIRDFPKGCGRFAPLVNAKPSEDHPVAVGDTENLRVGEEGFVLGDAKHEKTLVMEAMDDGQTCKVVETVKPVIVGSLNTQEPESVDLEKNSNKIELLDSIKDPDGFDTVNNATQPEAKVMQRSTVDAVMLEATSSILEPRTLIPVVGNVDKKYPPRRRISALRDFPPGCGINAPKLSKEEHRNGTDSSKIETLNNENSALGTKQSEQDLKGDTRKTREDVHDEDTYESNLRQEDAIKESATLESKCMGSQNSTEERKIEKMVKGDAGKIREELNNVDTLKCILKGDGIKEFLDSAVETPGQNHLEAAAYTDHVEAAFHGKLKKENMRESSVKQTPKSILQSNSKTPSVSKRTDVEPSVSERIDRETASSGGKSGKKTVELSKHNSFRRTSAGNLKEESHSVNPSQGEESAGLGPSGDRVIVQALMAAPNCPWRQGKRGFKSPPSRGPSGGKGKKHDMHESSKSPSKKKKGPGNSEEKPTKRTMPHTGNDSKQCADIQLVLVDENESRQHDDKNGNIGPSGGSSKKSDMHDNSMILSRKKNRRGNSEETSTGTPHTEKNSNQCYDNQLVLVDEHDVIVLDDEDEDEDENLRLIGDKEEKDDVHLSEKRDGQDEYDSPGDDEEDENFALVPRSQARSMSLIPFGLHAFDDKDDDTEAAATRNKVRETLRLFQGIFRKLLRDEEAKSKVKGNNTKRVDLISAKILKEKNKWVNTGKQILGPVPGVEVGDEFHFRVELAIVGLHRPFQGGIDYLKKGNRILATSIVASGGHNEMDSSDVLIYSGQGGNPVNGVKQAEDQKLERGNLALKNSMDESSAVRVIRGFKETKGPDSVDAKGKVVATYIYDGLYLVERYWQEIGRYGTNIFMFRLRRIPGQPELALKEVKKLKKYRVGICVDDISQGSEKLPICAVNTVDHEKPPSFKYITSMIYPSWYNPSPPRGCECTNGCSDSEKCLCAVKNGGEIPFNHSGAIVEAKPLVYECGPSCKCPPSCHNRVSQHGIKFQLEIFKTESRGWGVRSLTSIPSGSFICEYTGELLEDTEAEKRTGSDEYLFDIGSNYNDRTLWDGLSKLMPPDLQSSLSCETVDDVGFTIDALEYGSVGRFINHSCSPNLYAQNVLYDHDDKRMPHIMLFAAENIPPLQELTYHYNYVVDQVRDSNGDIKKKECFCGSLECSGRLY